MQKTHLLILLFLSLFSTNFSQEKNNNSSFISVYVGDLSVLSENFIDFYDSKNDLVFGIGFGIPISRSFSFDASISYYQKRSEFSPPLEIKELTNTELEQFIYNAGFQIHLLPNRIVGLSFLFGLNFATISEVYRDIEDKIVYDLSDTGNLGVYGGANFEINLGRSPVALHGDVKYTYAWDTLFEFADTYREISYTGGIKVYLAKGW